MDLFSRTLQEMNNGKNDKKILTTGWNIIEKSKT